MTFAAVTDWHSKIDLPHPHWDDYRDQLQILKPTPFPSTRELNQLLPDKLCSLAGKPIRFVPASEIPDVAYEQHIYTTGEVSTRENSFHDLFNALAWSRFPRLKVAMNAAHFRQLDSASKGRRGKQRDALTLFDESGTIVCSSKQWHLEALAAKDWRTAFQLHAGAWKDQTAVSVVGHALLEKFLHPYKSLTAHALLLYLDEALIKQPRESLLQSLDDLLAEQLLAGRILNSPAGLSPLPLMGIPGWWPQGEQDSAFYADPTVFRAPPAGFKPAAIHSIRGRNAKSGNPLIQDI
jgi:hypothetical protein